jgi:hypothetical protein
MSSEVEPVEVEAPKQRGPEPEPVVVAEPPQHDPSGALFDTGMGAGMGAPTVPTLLRQLSRRPPEERAAGVADLNGRMGNRRLARMIALDGPVLARREIDEPADPTPADEAAAAANDAEALTKAIQTKELGDIKAVSNFGPATQGERIEFITVILDQGWVGPEDEAALERIWNSFGKGIVEVVNNSSDLWDLCVDRGMDPSNIAAVRPLRGQFEADVKALAKGYMAMNLEYATEQMTRLNVNGQKSESPTAEMEESIAIEEIQELARGAEELLAAKDRMRGLHVGYRQVFQGDHEYEVQAHFDPETPPTYSSGGPEDEKAPHDWKTVKEQWDLADAAIAGITAQNPTVFAAMSQDRDDLKALGEKDPKEAKAVAAKVLGELHKNITATIPKIDTGDLDWMDLKPIHQQLFGGRKGPSGVEWNQQLPKSVAGDVVGDHESAEFWVSLGLGTASAALFIVASIATGGLATAALLGGLAVGSGTAAKSWENYEDLATAAAGTATEETRLISEGQVDAARIQAILDTIFAVLDLGQAVGIYKGIRAGAKLAEALAKNSAEAVLESGMKEGGEAAAKAIERSVAELGAEATARKTGKTADELLALLPADSAAAKRIQAARGLIEAGAKEGAEDAAKLEAKAAMTIGNAAEETWKQGRPLGELLQDIPAAIKLGLDRAFIDNLVIEGIERMGAGNVLKRMGGWNKAAKTLTDESAAAGRFMAWRDAIFDDLQQYAEKTLKGEVKRTGTVEKFSNDIDMSFMGKNASEVRDGAAQYLSKRLGVANSPGEFDRLLMAGLFTDPRRMHAYDGIPDALRETIARVQASKQESLIWNRRLWEATQHGDEALAKHIRDEMSTMGVKEFAYKPLSPGDISRLSKRIDGMHGELDAAVKAGDTASQARVAEEIGDAQALINASESGGYFSGGGVRDWVSERGKDVEKHFPRLPGATNAERIAAEKVTSLIDQLPKLDHSMLQLGGNAESVVSGIRGIGKYGERLLKAAGEAGGVAGKFDALATECATLKQAADKLGTNMTAAQAQDFSARAAAAMAELKAVSSDVLAQARQAANMPDVGDAMGAIQHMTIAHTRLLRSNEWTLRHINKMVRAIEQGRKLSELEEGQQAPGEQAPAPSSSEPNASFPPPNQSVAPPAQ